MSFDTPLSVCGPLREPKQMLEEQVYDGHTSIHDDDMAEKLGFRAGPIEGPTHFSQFVPLLAGFWGQEWFERGCISTHFQNMVVEGEAVRAFARVPEAGAKRTDVWAEKADGTPVLIASASIGPDHGETLLETRMNKLTPPGKLVILENLHEGMKGKVDEPVRMDADQHMGGLYPFSLNDKLGKITENSDWYSSDQNPWGRPIIPLEMVSVLGEYTNREAGFPVKGPVIGLFADLEIRMIDGPLLVGEDYLLRREIVKLAESKRTESYWTKTQFFDQSGDKLIAEMLLNHAVMKNSYEGYEEERAKLEAG